MKHYHIFMILLAIGMYSCEKDSSEYPIIYSGYMISGYDVKIFTKDGEITTPELKDKIIQRKKGELRDFENPSYQKEIISRYLSEVTYLSENSVKLTIDNKKENKPRIVYKIDDLIYWEKQDISEFPAISGYGEGYLGYSLNTSKLKPLFYEIVDISDATGYNKVIRTKECYYVYEMNGEFKIPMYEYSIKSYKELEDGGPISSVYSYMYSYPSNNRFNEDCFESIGENDTLTVQQYFINLKQVSW